MTIGTITLYVENMGIMVKFYNEVMEMGIEWDSGGFCAVKMENGIFFILCEREKPLTAEFPNGLKDTHQLTFTIPDACVEKVNEQYEKLIKAGAKHVNGPVSQPYGMHEAVVADPEGNFIEFCCEI